MTKIFIIAKKDFKSICVSSRAAAIFFFFTGLMSFFFYSFLASFLEAQSQAATSGGVAANLEQMIRAIFYNLHFTLILIIPAITMSTFAEENRSQTMRLLLSAPVSSLEIVLGKFLATLGLMFLVLIASSVFPIYLVIYGNPDVKIILSSYLGIFLIISAQLSFGIWISSMTNSQIMAFIFTMFGLFALMILNWITPNIVGEGILENTLKYLASTDHLDMYLKGMVSIKDTAYFILFTVLFLFFTNVVIDSRRWR